MVFQSQIRYCVEALQLFFKAFEALQKQFSLFFSCIFYPFYIHIFIHWVRILQIQIADYVQSYICFVFAQQEPL